jgi:hypothetical protein
MARFQLGDHEGALEDLRIAETQVGVAAFADLESPLSLHHDDLAIWLALKEARDTMQATEGDAAGVVDRLPDFQERAVHENLIDSLGR